MYYKAFNKDRTCKGVDYSIGDTFEVEGKPILCKNGIHFCKELVLTFQYYKFENCPTENSYAVVEPLGEVVWEQPTEHKGCTNKLKIVRWLTDAEVLEMLDRKFNSGSYNSGSYNSGNYNSGDYNSGNYNSGAYNSGNYNLGDCNLGRYNLGRYNSGNYNLGNYNSGGYNSGSCNSGYHNPGDYNSGNSNLGRYNSGSFNSGYFNNDEPETIRVFGKDCLISDWEDAYKPSFLKFEPKQDLTYKGNFFTSWKAADKEDRIKIKNLPNFDKDIFFNITGIDVDKD